MTKGNANVKPSRSAISAEAVSAIGRGDLVHAIRLTREQTGLGLKEAKELVETHGRDDTHPNTSGGSSSVVATEAVVALQKGKLIDAVKAFRERNGGGLKDAKEAVERYLDEHPLTKRQFREAALRDRRRIGMIILALLVALALGYVLATGQPG